MISDHHDVSSSPARATTATAITVPAAHTATNTGKHSNNNNINSIRRSYLTTFRWPFSDSKHTHYSHQDGPPSAACDYQLLAQSELLFDHSASGYRAVNGRGGGASGDCCAEENSDCEADYGGDKMKLLLSNKVSRHCFQFQY